MHLLFRPIPAVICATFALPAFADLTAEDVWADLQIYTTSFGYEVSGQPSREGDSLVVLDMTVRAAQLPAQNGGAMTLERVVFQEMPDGSVSIALPEVMPLEVTSLMETGETATVKMDYIQSGMEIVVTGNPDDLLYTYSANSVSMQNSGIKIDGLSGDDLQPTMNLVFEGISGTTDMTQDSQRRYDQKLDVASIAYNLALADPAAGESVEVKGDVRDLAFAGNTALPIRSIDPSDMNAMLLAGFAVDGEFTFGANGFAISGTAPNEKFSAAIQSQKGSAGVAMNADKLTYDLSQSETNVEMMSAEFPLPISFGVSQTNFKVSLPVRQSDDPQTFALGFSLDGFSMSDVLWGIFDPTNQLPRDPARVALDLAGQARLLFDFLNPDLEAMQAEEPGSVPVELEKVDINRLHVNVAGADLSGNGKFTFETTPMGVPQPVGAVDFTLVGGNALIDKLVAAGLVPEQQAMAARMMLGLLAVPGDAPDTLNSKIEINEMGHVSANGQRIQ